MPGIALLSEIRQMAILEPKRKENLYMKKAENRKQGLLGRLLNSAFKRTKSYQELKETQDLLGRLHRSVLYKTFFLDGLEFHLRAPFSDYIERQVACGQFYEIEILRELDPIINECKTLVDAGANIGNHSLYWASKHPQLKIFSFEPIKETYDYLLKNVESNGFSGRIEAINAGLSEKTCAGAVEKFHPHNAGEHTIMASETGDLRLVRLDDVITPDTKVDFIKVDVEGHEYEMLLGARETIKRSKPIIFIETFANNRPRVHDLLVTFGLKLQKEFPGSNFLYKF
ncbi:FkbM family methyltransferase [Pseudovibrio sp. SPO723]|uniref:FkbM family methyltransferase n=1 Tax=Nesiotobacter zosterae TaxID=392721 RepID=UPI0029C35B22|nr:FkbM family methyltransferase [Pseudovibrio sp. SPO723]MDX5595708.1 FkbM family methyltransferase [Pseudovibrio sp. SPO723]